jgi:hypothetical protein
MAVSLERGVKEADLRCYVSGRAYHVLATAAWRDIWGSAVQAEREGNFLKDLKDKDVKAVIEVAQKAE